MGGVRAHCSDQSSTAVHISLASLRILDETVVDGNNHSPNLNHSLFRPIMTKGKQIFRNFCKCIKNRKQNTLFT
jgi:hypothetical protein